MTNHSAFTVNCCASNSISDPDIRRRLSEEFNEDCIQGTVKHGGDSVMEWRCICGNEKGILVQVKGKMDTSSCMTMHLPIRLI